MNSDSSNYIIPIFIGIFIVILLVIGVIFLFLGLRLHKDIEESAKYPSVFSMDLTCPRTGTATPKHPININLPVRKYADGVVRRPFMRS